MLLKSCAMPPASVPIASSRCAWRSSRSSPRRSSSARCRSVTSCTASTKWSAVPHRLSPSSRTGGAVLLPYRWMLRPAFRTAGRGRCLPTYSPPQAVYDQRSPTATNVHAAATLGFSIRCAGSRSRCHGSIASRHFPGVALTLPMRDVQRAAALTKRKGNGNATCGDRG